MPSINNPAQVASLQIAGRVFTDLANLKCLIAGFNGAANGVSSFRTQNGVTYTPSGSKSFRFLAARMDINGAGAAGTCITLGYADNDRGTQSNTAATNPVYIGGYAWNMGEFNTNAATGILRPEIDLNFLMPNAKYPFVINNASIAVGRIWLYGYEEAV